MAETGRDVCWIWYPPFGFLMAETGRDVCWIWYPLFGFLISETGRDVCSKYAHEKPLGHTKLIPWSSDFVFEKKERVSEIFIFVQNILP